MNGSTSANIKNAFLRLCAKEANDYKHQILLAPLFKILEVIFDLLTPIIIAAMVDRGVLQGDIHTVLVLGLALVLMNIVGFSCTVVAQRMASYVSQGIGGKLRDSLFFKIMGFNFADKQSFSNSALLTRLTSDINQVQIALALGIRQLIRWPLIALGSLISAIILNPYLGSIFLITTPLIGLVFWLVIRSMSRDFLLAQSNLDQLGQESLESIKGMKTIRAYNMEQNRIDGYRFINHQYKQNSYHMYQMSSYINPLTFLILDLGIVAILQVSGMLVPSGNLASGDVLAFINYMTQTLLAVGYVANLVVVFTKANTSASRIMECLNMPESTLTPTPQVKQALDTPFINLTEMSFTYPEAEVPALKNLNVTLARGEKLGVIGSTGSGKTTLIRLLAGILVPTEGIVNIDGCAPSALSAQKRKQLLSVAFQKPQFIPGTIKQNITIRNREASESELQHIIAVSQMQSLLDNHQGGLDELVQGQGTNFSGGEKQRIALAAALLCPPELLLRDDATSALDAHTNLLVQHEIDAHFPDLTQVIVSEKISQVAHCTKILVLDRGEVVGLGTHTELLKTCDLYRELYNTQVDTNFVKDSNHE